MNIKTSATLTCPNCSHKELLDMPTNACVHFYKCTDCGETIKPNKGNCCVFCSFADSKCPPEQSKDLESVKI